MSFDNELAIVTGGYSGMGAATVEMLAAGGATCVVLGRNSQKAQAFIDRLPQYKGQIHFYEADVAQVEQTADVIDMIAQKHGPIHMLVNSAGTSFRKAALDYTVEDWKKIVDTNLMGTFFTSQAAAKVMKQNGGGRIVNIGSMLSHYGVHNVAVYGASKGGVSQITRTLAVEWAEYGIRVNQVSPGYIATPFVDLSLPENRNYRDRLIKRTPLGRLGTPEDVAQSIVYFLSHQSEFVTGQILAVDGGILGGDPTLNPLKSI